MTVRMAMALVALVGVAAPAAAQEGFTSELERVAGASREEKLTYVQDSVTEILDSFTAVEAMLEAAKESRDAKAVQCVSSRYAALRALAAVSEQAELDMIAAVDARNHERADHEFRKVAVALQRTRMLHAEAERCVGGQDLADGETSVQIVGDEDPITFDDSGDIPDVDIGFDPPDVSPFE